MPGPKLEKGQMALTFFGNLRDMREAMFYASRIEKLFMEAYPWVKLVHVETAMPITVKKGKKGK